MAVLVHERPDGELVVSACDWPEGVRSFNSILEGYYGDSPKSIWEIAEREERGVLSAVGVAGDVIVLSAHRLMLGRDGITVVPDDGVPWLLVRRGRGPSMAWADASQLVSSNHGSQARAPRAARRSPTRLAPSHRPARLDSRATRSGRACGGWRAGSPATQRD